MTTAMAAGPHLFCFEHYIEASEHMLRCATCGAQVTFDPDEVAAVEIAQHRLGKKLCPASAVKEAA